MLTKAGEIQSATVLLASVSALTLAVGLDHISQKQEEYLDWRVTLCAFFKKVS